MIIPVGTRVKRGPTWIWLNQDSGGLGTVTSYSNGESNKKVGEEVWQRVQWDSGRINGYRVGLHQDVIPVGPRTSFKDFL